MPVLFRVFVKEYKYNRSLKSFGCVFHR